MEKLQTLFKTSLLVTFSLLNAIDLVQTISFLRAGVESNSFAVDYPYLWIPLKFVFLFGFPLALYKLDVFLRGKTDDSRWFWRALLTVTYFAVLIADLYFLLVVIHNVSFIKRP
jgi:hypothetical protein